MDTLQVRVKKLSDSAKIPTYAYEEDAGMDVYADGNGKYSNNYIEYSTGIAIEIPKGYVGYIFPRSSISDKNLSLCNSVGVIDSTYRGELKFRFKAYPNAILYLKGDRIGQLIIMPRPKVIWDEVDTLSDTERGFGGYGSTGV